MDLQTEYTIIIVMNVWRKDMDCLIKNRGESIKDVLYRSDT